MDSLLLVGLNNTAWAAALALVIAVIGKVYHRPALLHALWLLVLVKLLTPSLVAVDPARFVGGWKPASAMPPASQAEAGDGRDLSSGGRDLASGGRDLASGGRQPPVFVNGKKTGGSRPPLASERRQGADTPRSPIREMPWRWQTMVGVIWLVGSAAWCSAVALGIHRFRRLLRSARPASAELRARVGRMAAKLGLRRTPATFTVSAHIPPMLWAIVGAPRLILPEALWDRLNDEERDAILAHELAHLKRRDEWARRLEAIALGLYWWNPVAWWARREVERSEEQCCDAWVLWALPDAGPSYARALVLTADFLSESRSRHPWPAGASGAGHLPLLKRRLTMILNSSTDGANPTPRTASRVVLILAGMGLLLLPAWALSEPPKAEPAKGAASETSKAIAEAVKGIANIEATTKPPVLDAPPEIANQVKFAQVISGEVSDYETYIGRIETDQAAHVRLPFGGTLKPECQSGQMVNKGDVLFEIDLTPFIDSVNKSRGKLAKLEQRLESLTSELNKVNAGEKPSGFKSSEIIEEINETRKSLKLARGVSEAAQAEVESAAVRIVAPIKGMVNREPLPNGLSCDKGQLLATITPVDSMLVEFEIDEGTFLKLRRQKLTTGKKSSLELGAPVEVTLSADPILILQGKIQSMDTRLDPRSSTLRCRASVPNPDGILIPGLSASVKLISGAPYEAVLSPREAFLNVGGGGYFVLVANDQDVIERRQVEIGVTWHRSVQNMRPQQTLFPMTASLPQGTQSLYVKRSEGRRLGHRRRQGEGQTGDEGEAIDESPLIRLRHLLPS